MCGWQISNNMHQRDKQRFSPLLYLIPFPYPSCCRKWWLWWIPSACQEKGASPHIPGCKVGMQKVSPCPPVQRSWCVAASPPAGQLVPPGLGACLLSSRCLPSSTLAAVPQQALLLPVPTGAELRAARFHLHRCRRVSSAGEGGSPALRRTAGSSQGGQCKCRLKYKCRPWLGGIKGKQLVRMGNKRAMLKWWWSGSP